jgi:hypothetical protein
LVQAFDALLTQPQTRIQGAWKRYLCLEIAAALRDLGPEIEDYSDLEALPEEWNAIINPDLLKALQIVETPKQDSLQVLIDKRLVELARLTNEITRHNEKFKRDRDISPKSQQTLKEYIEAAQKIDDKAPLVEGGFEIWQRNQAILTSRGSR